MELKTLTRNDFIKNYWNYFLLLEQDFLNTEKYISIDINNAHSFSIEYLKLYLSVCSEVDVILKTFCKLVDNAYKGDNIMEHLYLLTNQFNYLTEQKVILNKYDLTFMPWVDVNIEVRYAKYGYKKYKGNLPNWWHHYNNVKHKRTEINSKFNKSNFNFANQENLLNALAGLFIIEKKLLWYINIKNIKPVDKKTKIEYQKSKLFEKDDVDEILDNLYDRISRLEE